MVVEASARTRSRVDLLDLATPRPDHQPSHPSIPYQDVRSAPEQRHHDTSVVRDAKGIDGFV